MFLEPHCARALERVFTGGGSKLEPLTCMMAMLVMLFALSIAILREGFLHALHQPGVKAGMAGSDIRVIFRAPAMEPRG